MLRYKSVLRDTGAVLLLWLLVVLFIWRISLAGRVLAGGDIFTYFYPYWAEATRAIRAGRLPLWNSYLFMGAPFLANSQVGFFYPPNWLLWLLLPAHRSVHMTIPLHLCLAAFGAYLWGRESYGLARVGGWGVGAVFALGGYLGAQIEHVNQVQGLAWLPLMLMLYDRASQAGAQVLHRRVSLLGLTVTVSLVLLAGHTQTAFISLVGLAVYGCGPGIWRALWHGEVRPLVRRLVLLAIAAVSGAALAGIQLAPTWELSRHSVRARGLPLSERVSFSLPPGYVGRALLPAFFDPISPDHIEHVAYVGITGLALAALGLALFISRHRHRRPTGDDPIRSRVLGAVLLVFLGLFFALGLYNPVYLLLARYVPGFAHFRVPARWLALYALGVSPLAGLAVDAAWRRQPIPRRALLGSSICVSIFTVWAVGCGVGGSAGRVGLLSILLWLGTIVLAGGIILAIPRAPRSLTLALSVVLVSELYLATTALPHSRATAAQAFTSLRPALAHLLDASELDPRPGARFLSMSDTTFDPGDLPLIEMIYRPQLSGDQLYQYVIAAKEKEILSPNLPLAFAVPAVDGYDGGVLPLEHFVILQRLLPSENEVSFDGRLRENLTTVPDGRWLSLFNTRYLITDKLQDAWVDEVFYDLQHQAALVGGDEARVAHIPRFAATSLGLVFSVEGVGAVPLAEPLGVVSVGFKDGTVRTFELDAKELGTTGSVARVDGDLGTTRLSWSESKVPVSITLEGTLSAGAWVVRGISLVDERTGSFQSLVISDRGRFRLVHSGDVKIYENLDVLPRAFIVPSARPVDDDLMALTTMADPAFNPASEVVLHGDDPTCGDREINSGISEDSHGVPRDLGSTDATMVEYHPERVMIEADLMEPGYLVLTDAWYPGWQVTVNGEERAICRANLLFRAVWLEAGQHQVVFEYKPRSLLLGGLISAIGLGLLILVLRVPSRRW